MNSTFKSRHLPVVIVRNRSWPAVSQICSLIRFPSSSMVLILKSMLENKIQLCNINSSSWNKNTKDHPTLVV